MTATKRAMTTEGEGNGDNGKSDGEGNKEGARARARVARGMATLAKKPMAMAARLMATATKRARARAKAARGLAMATRVAGDEWGWGQREGHGCLHYDWREGCDGGNGPWFVCIFVHMERPQKIRSDLKIVYVPWSL